MISIKQCILVTLIATIVTIECHSGEDHHSHNWEMGVHGHNDRLLYRGIFHESATVFKKQVLDVEFPKIAAVPPGPIITYIKATDQYQDGKGGYVTLKDGGVGSTHVILHLKSQRGHGFNFIVEIYGR